MSENENNNIEMNETSQSNLSQSQTASEPKKKNKKWLIPVLVVLGILILSFLLFGSCTVKTSVSTSETSVESAKNEASLASDVSAASGSPSWAIYMYVCGSDLESGFGAATGNVEQLLQTDKFPDNLTVVMEVGGTTKWDNEYFSADELGIWTITKKDGLKKLESLPQACMGEKNTFLSFSKYCSEKYPADNTMFIVSDHGGGPQSGACWDENYEGSKSLQINEIAEVFRDTFAGKPGESPLDIINFDCCLMCSEEIAYQLRDCADILIASEEAIPGDGQDYTGFLSAIYNNPSVTPLEFSKTVVENYGKKYGMNSSETLSAIDLSKMDDVNEKMDAFAGTLIKQLYADPHSVVRIAIKTDDVNKFNINTRVLNTYWNLVDVSDFAKKAGGDSREAQELIQAVDEAVISNFTSSFHDGSGGLSMYYAIKPDDGEYESMLKQGTSVGFKAYHQLTQGKALSDDSKDFITGLGENPDVIPNLELFANITKEESYPVSKNSEGKLYVDFGPEIGSCSTNAISPLYRKSDDGYYYRLGTDDEIKPDWNEGIFVSEFENKWFTIGPYLACAELTYDSKDYNLYMIPFKNADVNDDSLNFLLISYDFKKDEWTDLGYITSEYQPYAHRTLSLTEGTEIRVVQYWLDENNVDQEYIPGTVIYSKDLIHYKELPDGEYRMNIYLEDAHKDTVSSSYYDYTIQNGEAIY